MLDRLTGLEVFAKVAAAGSLSAGGRPWAGDRPMGRLIAVFRTAPFKCC